MIGTSKPLASLSSGLLARKGQARPAMRPQGFLQMTPGTAQDDLGWNDMGEDYTPAGVPAPAPYIAPVDAPIAAPKPQVLRQIESLDEQLAAPHPAFEDAAEDEAQDAPAPVLAVKGKAKPMPEVGADEAEAEFAPAKPEPAATAAPKAVKARVAPAVNGKLKAAFTLRLDNDRHLRLRLASALTRRSAQQLVTEALDQLLESLDGVDALARQVEPAKNHG